MRRKVGIAAAFVVLAIAGLSFAAPDAKTGEERDKALGIVRLFRTAEGDYLRTNGRYATLAELIKSTQLAQTATNSAENLHAYFGLNLASESEPAPGFVFELHVPADGSAYKLSLASPGRCSFGFHADEKGSLYEDTVSDCTTEADEPTPNWRPNDIDWAVPTAHTDVACPLPQILEATTRRAHELQDNLQKFTARERIEHLEIGKNGKPRSGTSSVFNYVAEILEASDGGAYINEYRSESGSSTSSPPPLADSGTAAFALLFLPHNLEEFAVTCEGLTDLSTRSVWQLHFVQRTDRANDFRAYRISNRLYPVNIKGRAWVAADTLEVLRLESDLLAPIKEINLKSEHLIIDYGPVAFPKRDTRLWLPESVALYIDYHGHRYERRHVFSDFQLFSVDTVQETKAPRLDKDTQIGKY